MKAVLALIIIYVGTFLVAIQGASNAPVQAARQNATATAAKTGNGIDPAKEENIRALLELVGAEETIQDAANSATEQYRQKLMEAAPNSDKAQAFVNTYLTSYQKKFDPKAVNEQLVGFYDQHFTDDEIKGLLQFYGSPLGQKVAAEMPKINREIQAASRAAASHAAREAWQELRAENPDAQPARPLAGHRRLQQNRTQPDTQQSAQSDSTQP